MYKPFKRAGTRVAIASLTLLLAVASFQSGAVATPTKPAAPAAGEFSGVENFVLLVYRRVLAREPDMEGFTYWTDQVEQHGPVAFIHAVAATPEWRHRWVGNWFGHWLDRGPDDGGFAYWTTFVADHGFDEFESLVGGSVEAYEVSGGTDADYVTYVYRRAASRRPTEAEMAHGLEVLATPGVPRTDFVSSVLHSEDGLALKVSVAYGVALQREADPAGEAYWKAYYLRTGNFALMQSSMLLSFEAWVIAQDPMQNQCPPEPMPGPCTER